MVRDVDPGAEARAAGQHEGARFRSLQRLHGLKGGLQRVEVEDVGGTPIEIQQGHAPRSREANPAHFFGGGAAGAMTFKRSTSASMFLRCGVLSAFGSSLIAMSGS